MDNKNGTTFSDLFSSTKEENNNTVPKTFGDILSDNSNDTKEETNNTNQTITFDSIFDKLPPNQPELNNNTSSKEIQKDEKNDIVENKKDDKIPEQQVPENINNIFDKTEQPKKDEFKNELLSADDVETKPKEETNIFFQDDNTIGEQIDITVKKESNEETQEKEQEKLNDIFDSSQSKDTENDNLEKEITKEETKSELLSTAHAENEIKEETNIFFQDSNTVSVEKSEAEERKELIENKNEFASNPFLTPDSLDNLEETKEANIEINPLFANDNNQQEEIVDNNANPFFAKENETETTDQQPEERKLSISTIEDNQKETKPDETSPLSTSPFFQEDEQKSEDNPFFQQQINLIENKVPNSPNGNIDLTKTKHYDVKVVKKKEPLIKVILGVLSYALFIFLLLIGVTLLVYVLDIKIRASKGDYSTPTFNAYVVLTGSMLPAIQVRDVVITKKVDAKDLNEGDVITFASSDSRFLGTIITHRIIKKNPKTDKEGYTFQTRGDNNNVADSALVTENNIYGKVILKIPKLGYLQEFLATDSGWIIAILIPCLGVISYDIVKLAKGLKRKKYKNIKVQK